MRKTEVLNKIDSLEQERIKLLKLRQCKRRDEKIHDIKEEIKKLKKLISDKKESKSFYYNEYTGKTGRFVSTSMSQIMEAYNEYRS